MASVSVTRNVGRDKLRVGTLAADAPFGESQGPFMSPSGVSRVALASPWPPGSPPERWRTALVRLLELRRGRVILRA
eukprot:4477238-Heterocapsa_arctica.AAC.1